MIKNILNHYRVPSISALVSFFLFFFLLIWTYSNEQRTLANTSSSFIRQIESLKGQIFLFNQLAETLLAPPIEPAPLLSTEEIYSLDFNKFSSSNATKLYNKLYNIFALGYSWLDSSDLLYFKFFDSNTLISDKPIPQYHQNEKRIANVFSKEYCEQKYICSRHLSKENLSDGFFFGNVHESIINDKKTLTIITPTFVNAEVIAEAHIDIDLEQWESLEGMFIHSERDQENLKIIVSNRAYQTHFVWKKTIKIDNFVTVSFERYYDTLLVIGLAVLLSFILFNYIITLYYREKKKHIITKLASMKDALTGCFNRKILNASMLKQKIAEQNVNTVIAFDGNKIKFINDTFGHDLGDKAIVSIAKAIKKAFRQEDIVVRTGGDEFIVIAFGLAPKLAHSHIKSINATLKKTPIIANHFVSVSAGISTCAHYEELKKAITKADNKLYKNKRKMPMPIECN